MGAETAVVETAVLVGGLVDSLLDSLDSANGLYGRLKRKLHKDESRRSVRRRNSFREYDEGRRSSRSSHPRRSLEVVRYQEETDDDLMGNAGRLVRQEFERGLSEIGNKFSVGDLLARCELQSHIISLQSALLKIYEATTHSNPGPIPQHLKSLLDSAISARAGSINTLTQQYKRMIAAAPLGVQRALPAPASTIRPPTAPPSSTSRAPTRTPSKKSRSRSIYTNADPDGTRRHLYCDYSLDLQDELTQPLCESFQTGGSNTCPCCDCVIPSTEGKSWEIIKEDPNGRGPPRVFHVDNRFVVKSHRHGKGFACVLCNKLRTIDTVMDSVKSLINHVWTYHHVGEYEKDFDISELLVRQPHSNSLSSLRRG